MTFKDFYEANSQQVYEVAFRFFKDADEAADVVQETFLRLMRISNLADHEDLERFFVSRSVRNALTYMLKIAYNVCLEIYRRKKVSKEREVSYFRHSSESQILKNPVENIYEQNQINHIIQKILASLSPADSLIYILYTYSNASVQEIQNITGKTRAYIRRIISQINKQVYQKADKEGFFS